jgi:hypothetical protein
MSANPQEATKTKKESNKTPVTMQDGRVVEFPESTKAKKEVLQENGKYLGVRWDFSNGQTRTILLTDLQTLTDSGVFACHGLSQKGGDEYASEKDVDDAVLAFDDLMDRLKKGEWSEKREGGFGGASVLARAISQVFNKTMDETRAFLRDLSAGEKMALRQAPELKPVIEQIEAEKAKGAKVDTGALLGKLGAAAGQSA